MKNICKIHFDGICIYLESTIKASLTGKIILIILNLIAWPGYIFIAAIIPGTELKSFIIPLGIIFLLLVFILGRYSTWNFWGKEFVRINTKSVSFSRSYGIIQTKEKIIEIDRLGYSYEHIRTYGKIKYGKIHLFDYDKNNNPISILETAVLIPESDAEIIMENINELYANEFMENRDFTPINLN